MIALRISGKARISRWVRILAPLVAPSAALWAQFTGHHDAAFILMLVAAAIMIVLEWQDWRTRRNEVLPTLSPEQVERLRAERDRDGDAAAVRQLREQYPDLRLVSAATMIRKL